MYYRLKDGVTLESKDNDEGILFTADFQKGVRVPAEHYLYLKELNYGTVSLEAITASVALELGIPNDKMDDTKIYLDAMSIMNKYIEDGFVERDIEAEIAHGDTSGATFMVIDNPDANN